MVAEVAKLFLTFGVMEMRVSQRHSLTLGHWTQLALFQGHQ